LTAAGPGRGSAGLEIKIPARLDRGSPARRERWVCNLGDIDSTVTLTVAAFFRLDAARVRQHERQGAASLAVFLDPALEAEIVAAARPARRPWLERGPSAGNRRRPAPFTAPTERTKSAAAKISKVFPELARERARAPAGRLACRAATAAPARELRVRALTA
jgi:hypothetical protein